MELKKYQKQVITDLKTYLNCLDETKDSEKAYTKFWEDKGIPIGSYGVRAYQNLIKNTPRICFKVPTGGGKTLLAASSIKPIIDSMPESKKKFVVWLVPSDTILTQTTKNLKNPDHPYHQKIAADFGGRFTVYSKEDLLYGQNFNTTSACSQLSIAVLSYASLKIDPNKLKNTKDPNRNLNRNLYKENGNYQNFPKTYEMHDSLIEGVDKTAAIQVINQQNPIVIVDESHHTSTDLSIGMLNNLNPSFILDLTATPTDQHNIISYVSARALKDEQMIKLPLIVYNRQNRDDVLFNAIDLRDKLEEFAKKEQKETKSYVRPIVLFQAEPKTNEDSETFLKIKENLIKAGIPKEHVAIKTANINEIKNIDLLSPKCSIRYIITVNALGEGWDCPFAYVLATLANRSSRIDVEQIVGRILRQPHTKLMKNSFLNMSYIFTCSNKFLDTVGDIRKGFENAGYSHKDCRAPVDEETSFLNGQQQLSGTETLGAEATEEDNPFDFDARSLKDRLENRKDKAAGDPSEIPEDSPLFGILDAAKKEEEQYNAESKETENSPEIQGIFENMKPNIVYEKYRKDVDELFIPEFYIKQKQNIFNSEGSTKLTKDVLNDGFNLRNADSNISFEGAEALIGRFDLEENDSTTPKYMYLSDSERADFKGAFAEIPREQQKRDVRRLIYDALNRKYNNFNESDLKSYIDRILQNLDYDQLSAVRASPVNYIKRIERHIDELLEKYRFDEFEKKRNTGQISCQPTYQLPKNLRLTNECANIPSKSLYPREGDMNKFESQVIFAIASLDCVEWWHRNPDKAGSGGFAINVISANHYPDFIIKTKGGKIILLETKGDDRDNSDSHNKAKIGNIWSTLAGENYLYYMVFENKTMNESGVYSLNEFKELMKTEIS